MEQIEDTRQPEPVQDVEFIENEVNNLSLIELFKELEDHRLYFEDTSTIRDCREALISRKIYNFNNLERE